jgi:hypothetical protein
MPGLLPQCYEHGSGSVQPIRTQPSTLSDAGVQQKIQPGNDNLHTALRFEAIVCNNPFLSCSYMHKVV